MTDFAVGVYTTLTVVLVMVVVLQWIALGQQGARIDELWKALEQLQDGEDAK